MLRPDPSIYISALPVPSAGTINAAGEYNETKKDEWGTEWSYRIFGLYGHPSGYPFSSWAEAAEYSFPVLPTINTVEIRQQKEKYLVFSGSNSLFEKLNSFRPMDEVLVDIQTEDKDFMIFLDRLVDYWSESIRALVAADVDVVCFGDDWGMQTGPILPPSVFRAIFKPRYQKLMDQIHSAGKKVFFHSCGSLGYVLDDLLDLGIDGLWPQIGVFDADPRNQEKCRDHKVAIYIHPDRQHLVPRGTPEEIETAVRGYAEKYHRLHGGGIFYIEIENDAPFENVQALVESVHRYR